MMPTPESVRPGIGDLAEIVAGLVDIDPDDREHWHLLFDNLDRRLPPTGAAWEVMARVSRELDGLAEDQEREAGRLVDAAMANRTRARRLWAYALTRGLDSGMERFASIDPSLNGRNCPLLRIIRGTGAANSVRDR